MKIRKARRNDAEAVLLLRNESIRRLCNGFYPDEVLARWTDGDMPSPNFIEFVNQCLYVAELNGSIVGCGAVDLSSCKIDAVFVAPQHTNQGIGRKLIEFLEEVARASNSLGPLKIESTLNAAPFYRKLGFVGNSISQYNSPRGFVMDCIQMHKSMNSSECVDVTDQGKVREGAVAASHNST